MNVCFGSLVVISVDIMQNSNFKIAQTNWHNVSIETCFSRLESNYNGLDTEEVKNRLTAFGLNRLPDPPKRNFLVRFLSHFHNILIYVLLGSAVITSLLGHIIDTAVILAVVIANAILGFIQEGKAERAMEAIRHMLAPRAFVLRSGMRKSIESESIVPGDIVILEAGDKVPADLRLITANGLQIQEAILTGESVPVSKQIKLVPEQAALGDRTNIAYSGTLITSGQGKGLVIGTGIDTEIGRISGLISEVEVLTTPLVKQMGVFAKWLTALILLIAAVLLVFGYFLGHYEFSYMFMAVVGLSVAAIPEGLPAVLTITLAVGVQKMARRNTIVRRLPAIETLGSVSVICTDKTGTLTFNEMMVTSVITHTHTFSLDGIGYEPNGLVKLKEQVINTEDHEILTELAHAAALCNDAELHNREGVWVVEGDPMEGALLAFAGKVGLDVRKELSKWTRTDEIPFDAKHRFMAALHHDHENHASIYVKGAPEQILSMCNKQFMPDKSSEPIDQSYWEDKAHEIAALGQRVLALAIRTVPPEHTILEFADLDRSLTFIGMVGLLDPPRPDAIEAIRDCHQAGIRVKMITGDHAGTAKAIGHQIGLRNPDQVLTGKDLDTLSESELQEKVLATDIFARTSPEHKLRLVTALQAHGLTVAMTGDGVNDAPALKRADAGIAMGKKGSEATKEAAEFVLVDDNFASIVAAVREGRTVYDNIKKVISWTLPTNAGEAMTIVVALMFGMTLPITPIQILWVNLITAITLGMALAFEPTETKTMLRPPRPRNQPLLTNVLAWHVILVSILFLCGVYGIFTYAIENSYSIELARTMAVNTLVVMEIFHLFFIRNFYGTSFTWDAIRGTRYIWATVIAITIAQLAITYIAPLQTIFETQSVPVIDGLFIIGIGIMLFTIIELEKQLRLRINAIRG